MSDKLTHAKGCLYSQAFGTSCTCELAGAGEVRQEPRAIDGKFGISGDKIVNLVSGEEIPRDEPLFILRARDNNAYDTLMHYLSLCQAECNSLHLEGIKQTIRKFIAFTKEHPERMKQPGITRHLKLEPAEGSASASPSVKDELERLEKLKAELKEYRVFGMGVDELRRKLYRLEEFEASASPEPRCKCSLIAGNVVPNPECPVHVEVASPEPLCSPIPPRGTLQCLRDAINLIHSEANRSERGGDMKTAQHWRDVAAVLSGNLLAETVRMESSPASPVPEPPSADAICMTCRGTKENPGTVWDEEENADLPCPQSWHVTIGTSPEPSDMTEALQAIEHALHRDKGSYWKARAYLDKHHKFHGDVQGEDVLLMVAQVALREAEARPAVPLGEAKK